MKGKNMFKKGFTLAEVLITLAIIGVVAALTIPSVISNYQQMEFKTGLKKAVSVLNEAIQTNIAQDGETPYENEDLFNYLQRRMSVIKTMKVWNSKDNRWGSTNDIFYTTDGMRFEIDNVQHKGTTHYGDGSVEITKLKGDFILHETGLSITDFGNRKEVNNGSSANELFYPDRPRYHCGSYGLSNNIHNTKYPPCIITVDVNGDKKPNPKDGYKKDNGAEYTYPAPTDKKLQDIFNILITEDRAIPFGVVAQRAMYSK